MKYFDSDLLHKYREANSMEERNVYSAQWQKSIDKYWEKFSDISNKLDDNLVTDFSEGKFHDAKIISMILDFSAEGFHILLKLFYDDSFHVLKHVNVSKFSTKILPQEMINYEYGYGEILLDDDDSWTHEFIFAEDCLQFIKCKELILE